MLLAFRWVLRGGGGCRVSRNPEPYILEPLTPPPHSEAETNHTKPYKLTSKISPLIRERWSLAAGRSAAFEDGNGRPALCFVRAFKVLKGFCRGFGKALAECQVVAVFGSTVQSMCSYMGL